MTNSILIAYFSRSGNTRKIATLIKKEVGGTRHEIQVKVTNPDTNKATTAQTKQEIRAGYKPALKSTLECIESYNTIFVGSPNWWSTIAPPVATFLTENDVAGKTIVPFCTHGGGGLGRVAQDIAKLCPKSTVLSSFEVYGSGRADVQAEVSAWLRRVGL